MQVRNWIGTLNGIDASFDAEGYLRTMVERGLAKYAVGQLERGSETGKASSPVLRTDGAFSSTSPHEDGYLRPFSLGTDVRVGSPSQGLCD